MSMCLFVSTYYVKLLCYQGELIIILFRTTIREKNKPLYYSSHGIKNVGHTNLTFNVLYVQLIHSSVSMRVFSFGKPSQKVSNLRFFEEQK